MTKKPLYIFVHLYKTGGTTLNKHLEKNFKKSDALFLYYEKLGLDPFAHKKPNYKKLTKDVISKLTKKEKNKIKIISGHFLYKDIVKYFPARKPYFITIVRDPFSRTKSFYNYFRTLYENEDTKGKKKQLYKSFLKVNNKIPTFDIWIRKKYGNLESGVVIHPMSIYFEDLGYKLSDFNFVGITKNLNTDLPLLYKKLGIKKFFINQNISKNFIKRVNKDTETFFKKKYKKSYDLFVEAEGLNKIQEQEFMFPGFEVWKMWIKIVTPFTQIIFDFVESLRMLSAFLRRRSKLYDRVWDTLKQRLLT